MERRKMQERRDSTIPRHNQVHQLYNEVIKELGEFAYIVPRFQFYKVRLKEICGQKREKQCGVSIL